MTTSLSRRQRRRIQRQRGGVLALVAVSMLTLLCAAGLAIDAGRGYIMKAQLSRAADAAALAAARALRQGTNEARAQAVAVAAANGVEAGVNGATLSIDFGVNSDGEEIVTVGASIGTPTILMRLLGYDEMLAQSVAEAAVPPIDLVLVLDQSGSLGSAGAWDDLQEAADAFVRQFDDDIDQVGMVSFNTAAETHFGLRHDFVSTAVDIIGDMNSVSYTNTGEGLRHAHAIFQEPSVRERAAKVVVFFTDGRPTAFTGEVGNWWNSETRTLVAWSGSRVQGFWQPLPETIDPVSPNARGCWSWRYSYCWGYDKNDVWDQAEDDGRYWADRLRSEGVLVYTIGLGNPNLSPSNPLLANPQYLRELANEGGMTNPNQPDGRMYFAPGPNELLAVFNAVASELLARLSR